MRKVKIPIGALARARLGTKQATQPTDVFKLPEFPSAAKPPRNSGMAMDDAFGLGEEGPFAFARNQALDSALLEGQAFLGYPILSLLAQRAEYRSIVETIATEMTRKWISFEASADAEDKTEKIQQLNEEFDRLQVRDVFRCMAEADGFFGRAHLYIDLLGASEDRDELKIPIGNGRSELSRLKLGNKKIQALRPVEAVWVYPTRYNSNDPLAPDWYKPTEWFVMGKEMHYTRLLMFVGREVPDLLKPAYAFGGLALTQMAKPYVDNWLRTRQSVSDLLHSFTVFVLGTDMQTTLQMDGEELFERADFFNLVRDNRGLFLYNKDTEQFENVSAPLSSMDQLQAQAQEQMAAVSRIPLVKLLGISPHGLNASSEGEIRVFYDSINAYQERFFRPNLMIVFHMIQMSLWGAVDDEISFKFEPLWSLDEKGEAEVRKIEAETGQVLVDIGAVSQEEERRRIAEDPGTPYQGLVVEDLPDLREQIEAGLIPKGGGAGARALIQGGGGESAEEAEQESAATQREEDKPDDDENGKEAGEDRIVPFDEETIVPSGGANALTHGARKDTARGQRAAERGITGGGPTTIGKGPLRHSGAKGGFDANGLPWDPDFAIDAEWEEAKHPRDPSGQFGSGGGGKTTAAELEKSREYFKKHWHEAGSVGGHKQPTPEQIARYTEAYEQQGKSAPALKPLDAKQLTKTGGQLGSNPGGRYKDETSGQEYYVKQARSADHARNEILAGALYKLAGAPALNYRPVEGGKHVATEWQKAEKNNARDFTPAELKKAQEDFAVHAWLANWDAAGLDYDNQSMINGVPTTNDLGGALEFRARGAPKGEAFGSSVGEWSTLRDAALNPQNARLFAKMTPEQLKQSAGKVAAIKNDAIRATVQANNGGAALAEKLIARKRDLAKRAGLATDQKTDVAGHMHAPAGSPEGGQFVGKAGGGGGAAAPAQFATKKEHVAHLLKEGTTTKDILAATGWVGVSLPALAKAAGLKLEKKGGKIYGTPMSAEEKAAAKQATKEKVLAKKNTEMLSGIAAQKQSEQQFKTHGAEPPWQAQKPQEPVTPQEIAKAKLATPVKASFVNAQTAASQALVQKFNELWTGTQTPQTDQLASEKVWAYKKLKADIAAVDAVMLAQQKEQAAAAAKKAAEAVAAAKQAAQAKNKEVMQQLGISETEATGFNALVEMMGSGHGDVIAQFKSFQKQAESYNLPVSGFQYALIKNYVDGGYAQINKALRTGSWSAQQHVYARLVNNALDKFPKYTGTVKRGTTLNQADIAKYIPGHVVAERGFTSTGIHTKFGGNVSYKIKANGLRGADFSGSANQNESEVLFKTNTCFLVHSVHQEGGVTHIEMEEVEGHG